MMITESEFEERTGMSVARALFLRSRDGATAKGFLLRLSNAAYGLPRNEGDDRLVDLFFGLYCNRPAQGEPVDTVVRTEGDLSCDIYRKEGSDGDGDPWVVGAGERGIQLTIACDDIHLGKSMYHSYSSEEAREVALALLAAAELMDREDERLSIEDEARWNAKENGYRDRKIPVAMAQSINRRIEDSKASLAIRSLPKGWCVAS